MCRRRQEGDLPLNPVRVISPQTLREPTSADQAPWMRQQAVSWRYPT
ncbi:MAG: hypothetical protein QOE03_3428, partial [Micromonosporaceae bacterium]|nr:hypothetical protein [Micromonosporaceae bacterium]